jgi:hypothetical protein
MGSFQKFFVPERRNTCLFVASIHFLQLFNGKFLNGWFDDRDDFTVLVEIWSKALEAQHIQGRTCFK